MKILLTPVEAQRRKDERAAISKKNKTCPLCGEDKDFLKYYETSDFLRKGTEEEDIYKIKEFSFFKKRKTKIDYVSYYKYRCYTCGARWIGDPIPHYCDI